MQFVIPPGAQTSVNYRPRFAGLIEKARYDEPETIQTHIEKENHALSMKKRISDRF